MREKELLEGGVDNHQNAHLKRKKKMKRLRLPRRYAALGASNLPSDIHLTDVSRRCCLANQNFNLVRHRSWHVIFITI